MNLMRRGTGAFALLMMMWLTGCKLPGRPEAGPEVPRPDQIVSFQKLYNAQCQGCHGNDGRNGAAINLHNPEYEGLIDDAALRNVIANGEKGVLMPAYAQSAGGDLTDQQVNILVYGMRTAWARPNPFGGAIPPPYKATQPGDSAQGQAVYAAACARCHGADAAHPGPSGSILDGAFLALMNAQSIRTIIIAGRPDIGQPDWRGDIPGRPLSDAEVTNVTAWLLAQTPSHPGRPYPSMEPNASRGDNAQPTAVMPNRKQ